MRLAFLALFLALPAPSPHAESKAGKLRQTQERNGARNASEAVHTKGSTANNKRQQEDENQSKYADETFEGTDKNP